MRALMLDFDGVVHPVSQIADQRLRASHVDLHHLVESRKLLRWMPLLVEAMEDHPDVDIVVHSGWRGIASNVQLREFLGPLAPRFIGVTSTMLPRYEGIVDFAERAGITEYVILDDAGHEFPQGLGTLILTDPELGLTDGQSLDRFKTWLDVSAHKRQRQPAMLSR